MFPSYPLDSLYVKKTCSNEELSSYDSRIEYLIESYENELNFLTNPKLDSSVRRQQYEFILARRDYMLAWFTKGLEMCSVASLQRYKSDLLNFYTNICHFSKSGSEYLLNCYITKRDCFIQYVNDEHMPRIEEFFGVSLGTMEQFGSLFLFPPLPEAPYAYRNFHKKSYIKHMLVCHFLNRGCTSTGIAEVLRRFNIDDEADDAKVRRIKCEKNTQYCDYLAHIKADFLKIPRHHPETSPEALEKIELYIDSGQFRFRENKA